MRKFRTSAVALATAAAVSISGVSVASAQSSFGGSSMTQIGKEKEAWVPDEDGNPVVTEDEQATGNDLFGDEVHDDANPQWAIDWREGAKILGITSLVGAIIGGINYLKYTGVLPYYP